MSDPTQTWRHGDDVAWAGTPERVVALAMRHSSQPSAFDELGSRVWLFLESPRTLAEVAHEFGAGDPDDPADAEAVASVRSYLEDLRGRGLLTS